MFYEFTHGYRQTARVTAYLFSRGKSESAMSGENHGSVMNTSLRFFFTRLARFGSLLGLSQSVTEL